MSRREKQRLAGTVWSPAGSERTTRYTSAEMTHWVAHRHKCPEGKPELVNIWSVIVLGRRTIEPGTQEVALGNGRAPETIPGTDAKLVRVRISMPVDDIEEILALNQGGESFTVPAMVRHTQKPSEVYCPGQWLPVRAVPRKNDTPDRTLMPWTPGLVWLAERDTGTLSPRSWLGHRGTRHVVRALRDELGIDLAHQTDRLGTLLVVWPEDRVDLHVSTNPTGSCFGGHIRVRDLDRSDLTIVVQAYREDELVGAHLVQAPGPTFALRLGFRANRYATQVFHKTEGLVYAEDAIPMREITLAGQMISGATSVAVQPRSEDGQPVGPPRDIDFTLAMPTNVRTGNVGSWERRRRASRARVARQRLVSSGNLRIFLGSADGRRKAVKYIREVISSHHEGPLRIWDEYFSGEELLMVIGSLRRVGIPIRILTGERAPTTHHHGRTTLAGELPPSDDRAVSPSIADVVRGLDAVADSVGARHDIAHRRGKAFHDRFLITDTQCYQLGSSFNSLGTTFSTILRLPDRELLTAQFDDAWNGGQA